MGRVRIGTKEDKERAKHNTQTRKEYWDKLKQLADEENVKEFFKVYSEYLEFDGIISYQRKALYKMVKLVGNL